MALEAQTRASAALWHLSSSTTAQQRITEADGIGLLVALLTSERVTAANHAACALFHLDSSTANKAAIVKAGGEPGRLPFEIRQGRRLPFEIRQGRGFPAEGSPVMSAC